MTHSHRHARSQHPPGLLSKWALAFISRVVPWALVLICLMALTGWLVGDVTPFFQWLSWVPAVVLLLLLVPAFVLSLVGGRRGGRVLLRLSGGLLLLVLFWTSLVDYGVLRASEVTENDLVLVNWNATIPPGEKSFEEARFMAADAIRLVGELEPEVIVIFNGSYLRLSPEWGAFHDGWAHVARSAGAMVMSQHEILEVRPILATGGSLVVKIRLMYLGKELVIWGFDLPSSPSLSRAALFASLQAQLVESGRPEPDLLLGDFNVPRGSRSLGRAFPEYRSAFSESGAGWSGTWPTYLPLWDLDQVLVGPRLTAVRYETVSPLVGMHRIQRVVLRWCEN